MSSPNINSIGSNNLNLLASSNAPQAKSKTGNERDMFMTLLVAQLKNQDPLAPQDGAQFVAQLAQFNSLDQLIGMRQSLEQLVSQLRTPQN